MAIILKDLVRSIKAAHNTFSLREARLFMKWAPRSTFFVSLNVLQNPSVLHLILKLQQHLPRELHKKSKIILDNLHIKSITNEFRIHKFPLNFEETLNLSKSYFLSGNGK